MSLVSGAVAELDCGMGIRLFVFGVMGVYMVEARDDFGSGSGYCIRHFPRFSTLVLQIEITMLYLKLDSYSPCGFVDHG